MAIIPLGWLKFFHVEDAPEPSDALMLDASDVVDIAIEVGDRVLFHGNCGDYVANVVEVTEATRFVPMQYHLHVETDNDLLTWVWCDESRITLIIKASALEAEAASA